MRVVLTPMVKRVKNGYTALSPELRISAYGYSPDAAKMNLERAAHMFLSPFARIGTLEEELKVAGVRSNGTAEDELSIYCE